MEDLVREIKERVAKKERVLVTTLTKKMAEDLAYFINQQGVDVRYLHSEIETLKRVEILRDLRLGTFDVLVGINLLREGLDLPEVSLVVILDADKEGYLRSSTALIQIIGRTARNASGKVILYGDEITGSMREAIRETERRRRIQLEYNKKHGIVPKTVEKEVFEPISTKPKEVIKKEISIEYKVKKKDLPKVLRELEQRMKEAAERMDYELAAQLRDEIIRLKSG
jgi:excinuclease ABC subunit B